MRLISIGLIAAAAAAAGSSAASTLVIPKSTAVAMRIVIIHNQVRAAVGVQPIYWDSSLALAADRYAAELARTERWGHSPQASRQGQGENLWMGTRGAFSIDQMVGAWVSEGRQFRAGRFPQVAQGGRWEQVGHYSQMIWPGSVRVGCAMRSSTRNDYLVCRYSPAGNVVGATVP